MPLPLGRAREDICPRCQCSGCPPRPQPPPQPVHPTSAESKGVTHGSEDIPSSRYHHRALQLQATLVGAPLPNLPPSIPASTLPPTSFQSNSTKGIAPSTKTLRAPMPAGSRPQLDSQPKIHLNTYKHTSGHTDSTRTRNKHTHAHGCAHRNTCIHDPSNTALP